jgi:hypothetical protein
MKLFALLLSAVLILASSLHASSINNPNGPGPWVPQPELDNWYARWAVFQNGSWHGTWTPATKFQCISELNQIEAAYPPGVGVRSGPGPVFGRRFAIQHPAWREARVIRDWMWCWPLAN